MFTYVDQEKSAKIKVIGVGGAGGNGHQIGGFGSDFSSQDLVQPTPNSGVPHAQNPSASRNETMQHAVRRNALLSCWVPAMHPNAKYALEDGGKAEYFQYLGLGVATSGTNDKMDELEAATIAGQLATKDAENCQHLTENHFSFALQLILYPPFYDWICVRLVWRGHCLPQQRTNSHCNKLY